MRTKRLIVIFSVIGFIALLIVFNSVIFSIKNVEAYCYNSDDTELHERVLSSHEIKKGSSIFFVNEQQEIDTIESRVANIYVRNIERKFPNSVSINYVKLRDYLYFESGGEYFFIANNGKITRSGDTILEDDSAILIKLGGKALSTKIGDELSTDKAGEKALIEEILITLERFLEDRIANSIEFIDISRSFIYFKTKGGAYFEMQNSSNMLAKLEMGISTYETLLASAKPEDVQKTKSGTFILTGNPPKANYTAENKYENG